MSKVPRFIGRYWDATGTLLGRDWDATGMLLGGADVSTVFGGSGPAHLFPE